jgi:superfamily II DNA/RNA helicase
LVASLQAEELQLDKLSKFERHPVTHSFHISVRFLVLDEADRLFDTEFVGQIEEIVALCSHAECQKSVFSATLPAKAEQIALSMLEDPIRVVVGLKYVPFAANVLHSNNVPLQRHAFAQYRSVINLCGST